MLLRRQAGLKEAQRYPDDYDGIIAGAPANYWTHLMAADLWLGVATLKDKGQVIFRKQEIPLITRTRVLAACDALDAIKDGFLDRSAQVPLRSLPLCLCLAALTRPLPTRSCRSRRRSPNLCVRLKTPPRPARADLSGVAAGASEIAWATVARRSGVLFHLQYDHFRYVGVQNPEWDWRSFDLVARRGAGGRKGSRPAQRHRPRLRAFKARGGSCSCITAGVIR